MFAYVARQAIMNRDLAVHGYELFFRDGEQNCFPDVEPGQAISHLISSSQPTLKLEELSDGKIAHITFYQDTLLNRFPETLRSESVVIEIIESVPISEELIDACKQISAMGYKIAINDHQLSCQWDELLPYTSLIKIDVNKITSAQMKKQLPKFIRNGIELAAQRVESYEKLQECLKLGFHYFQGCFFEKPEMFSSKGLPASKKPLLELITESAKVSMDYSKINSILGLEQPLSVMLLRFINHPISNQSQQVSSLSQALNDIGETEVKKLIALLALSNLGNEKPEEIVNMSLVRAKFCDILGTEIGVEENPPQSFLVGLFSMLDALLDQEMEEIVSRVSIMDELKVALCGTKNHLGLYLELAKAFETANWPRTKNIASVLRVDQRKLHSFYNRAIMWGNAMASAA